MHEHTRKIRIIAATGIVAAAVLATGSAGAAKAPATTQPTEAKGITQIVRLPGPNGDEIYVRLVDGVQRGLAMR